MEVHQSCIVHEKRQVGEQIVPVTLDLLLKEIQRTHIHTRESPFCIEHSSQRWWYSNPSLRQVFLLIDCSTSPQAGGCTTHLIFWLYSNFYWSLAYSLLTSTDSLLTLHSTGWALKTCLGLPKHFGQEFEYPDSPLTLHWRVFSDFYWFSTDYLLISTDSLLTSIHSPGSLLTCTDLNWLNMYWVYWSRWNYHQLTDKVTPREGTTFKVVHLKSFCLSTPDSFRIPLIGK